MRTLVTPHSACGFMCTLSGSDDLEREQKKAVERQENKQCARPVNHCSNLIWKKKNMCPRGPTWTVYLASDTELEHKVSFIQWKVIWNHLLNEPCWRARFCSVCRKMKGVHTLLTWLFYFLSLLSFSVFTSTGLLVLVTDTLKQRVIDLCAKMSKYYEESVKAIINTIVLLKTNICIIFY